MRLTRQHWRQTMASSPDPVFDSCQLAIPLLRRTVNGANLLVDGRVTPGTGHPDMMALFDMR
jgi:hypothetical protein